MVETVPLGNSADYNPADGVSAGVIKLIFSNKAERPSAFSPCPQTIIGTPITPWISLLS